MPVPNPHPAVDYAAGRTETAGDYPGLAAKFARAIEVVRVGLTAYDTPAVRWTGGKDSTLLLYLVRRIAERDGLEVPPVVFIDHGQHFPEVVDFVHHWAGEWGLDLVTARNDDVTTYLEQHDAWPNEPIPVDALNERNRHHVRDVLEYEEDTFPFDLDSPIGNHLLTTVALDDALETHGVDAVFNGTRWDEEPARADETFFSPHHDPKVYSPHDRIQPLLQFTEASVWNATWTHLVPEAVPGFPESGSLPERETDLPVSPKYFEGFRSLGHALGPKTVDGRPAWLQTIDHASEGVLRTHDRSA